MSLKPIPIDPVPEQTARICKAAFLKGSLYIKMHDAFGTFFEDAQFADLFARRGQPAQSPWRLALVTVMQYVEGLSDLQAAEAVRSRMDWKYALSLELEDTGFDSSVLCEFRTRLLTGQAEARLFETMLARFSERKLLKERGRQRTDSTHVLAAVHNLHRLQVLGETLRYALNSLAQADPVWLSGVVDADWFDRYSSRLQTHQQPQTKEQKESKMQIIARDGLHLLQALYAAPEKAAFLGLPAVEVLRRVWLQQIYIEQGQWQLRSEEQLPPCAHLIVSPYDVEAHFSVKRQTEWAGYKAHLTETCDADTPHLITQVATTPATTQDSEMTAPIQASLAEAKRLPNEHLVDEGYTQASAFVQSRTLHEVTLIGPVANDRSRQARAGQGFGISDFTLDWERQRATCPVAKVSKPFAPTQNASGKPILRAQFSRTDCQACGHRLACTNSKTTGRTLYLHPKAEQKAREEQQGASFRARYKARAGIEGTLSQAVRALGLRRCRYIGLAKTHLQHLLIRLMQMHIAG